MELYHHGVKGQKWYVRRYQNPDGTLTPLGRKHVAKADKVWAKKYGSKITDQAKRETRQQMNEYGRELMNTPGARNKDGRLSAQAINAYNRKMAEVMSMQVSDIKAPSGRVVSFIAKRGEVGVFMALSETGYNANAFKNGVWTNGKVAYRKDVLNKMELEEKG